MPADAKLCWITRPTYSLTNGWDTDIVTVVVAFDAAPEPVKVWICPTCNAVRSTSATHVFRDDYGVWHEHAPAVKYFAVPAPSQLEPPDEATT